MNRVLHPIDRVEVTFDDPNLVANAGLLLVGTLVVRLELEWLVNQLVRLVGLSNLPVVGVVGRRFGVGLGLRQARVTGRGSPLRVSRWPTPRRQRHSR